MWEAGRVRNLRTLGGVAAVASDLSEQGQIVGRSRTKSNLAHAFVWQDRTMTDLGTLPGGKESDAVAINEHNQIVGYSTTKTGKQHAVLWTLRPGS